MFTEFRLKIRKFFRKYRKIIIIVFVIWAIIFVIDKILKNQTEEPKLNTTIATHEEVLKSEYKVPEKLKEPIENTFYEYVLQCNKKNYDAAFALLAEDCRNNVFDGEVDNFKKYVDSVFNKEKRYSIQDYSNYGGFYIYNLKLIDDIIKTGLTNQEYAFYEEKVALKQNGDKIELYIDNYMGAEELKKPFEDDNVKIRLESKVMFYGYEIYTIRITNKTEQDLVLYDGIVGNEIYFETGEEARVPSSIDKTMWMAPGETKTFKVTLSRFYDENAKVSNITFNKIRIMDNYTGEELTEEEETSKASKLYSVSIPLN